ncbi:MAG: SCO family protein [Balneolaceae bacterium]
MKQLLFCFAVVFLFACNSPKIIDDLSDVSFTMLNQDNVEVTFPDDYKGKYVVMGFLYTNCPDVCPMITQNMKKIQTELGNPDDIQFVGVSFDYMRDTPSVLKGYKEAFDLDENFNFLTAADTTVMNAFLDTVRVRSQVSFETVSDTGEDLYFLNHSDKIMVINPKGHLIFEYGGSMTRPAMIVEDIRTVY